MDFDQLLSAARTGDGAACTEIWHAYSPAVFGFLRGRGLPDPEDVTSDVFLAVFKGLVGFVGTEEAFRSWVFAIAYRRCADERRRLLRRRHLVPYQPTSDTRTAPSAEEMALSRVGDDLQRALSQLSPDQKDVLLLRFVADLTLEQVAELVGKPLGAVKSLQHRGLTTLRTRLSAPVSSADLATITPPR